MLNYELFTNSLLYQTLAVYEKPVGNASILEGFAFCGYDIMDSHFSNSTLTNYGAIPEAFTSQNINNFGLGSKFGTAMKICEKIRI